MGLKTKIYAPRLYGDIDLGLEPSRIDSAGNRDWARMIFPGMRLPGQTDQLVTVASTTQKFTIGTRRIEYGRTFRYSRCGTTFTTASHAILVKNGNYDPESTGHEDEHGFYGDLYTAADTGATYVDLEMADTTETYEENFFQGGYLTPFDSNYNVYYIVASDASGALYCRCYLDHPLVQDISATNGIDVFCSPYRNVVDGSLIQTRSSCIGRCLAGDVAADSWFWLQTAGPCWAQPTDWSAQCPNYASDKLDVYANQDGSICLQVTTGSRQRVGYVLAACAGVGTGFFMLQLE